jgi:hypothetical protein
VRLVSGLDAFDEVDAIEHRTGCPIPFGDDEDLAFAELFDGFREMRCSGTGQQESNAPSGIDILRLDDDGKILERCDVLEIVSDNA